MPPTCCGCVRLSLVRYESDIQERFPVQKAKQQQMGFSADVLAVHAAAAPNEFKKGQMTLLSEAFIRDPAPTASRSVAESDSRLAGLI